MSILGKTVKGVPTRRLQLPADDGPMAGQPVQWWYWTGHLDSVATPDQPSRRFGFEMVFFDFAWPGLPTRGLLGHCAITDAHAEAFIYDEHLQPLFVPVPSGGRFDLALDKSGLGYRAMEVMQRTAARTALPQLKTGLSDLLKKWRPDGWRAAGLRVMEGDDNTMAARGGSGEDHLRSVIDGYELKLTCACAEPPVQYYGGWAHGYDAGGYTWYYSRPRMAASGTLRLPDGAVLEVQGRAWFDRQIGDLDKVIKAGYLWLALGLDNGDDVMLAKLKAPTYPHPDNYAAIHSDGKLYTLSPHEFDVEVLSSWTSPSTGRVYPNKWRVRVPARGIDWTVVPVLQAQELVPPTWLFTLLETAYWEGDCDVLDSAGQPIGRAYVEVSNW